MGPTARNKVGTSSSSKTPTTTTTKKRELELAERVKGVTGGSSSSLTEIAGVVTMVEEALGALGTKKGSPNEKPRLWNYLLNLRFQILKVIQERLATPTATGEDVPAGDHPHMDLVLLAKSTFDQLICLPAGSGTMEEKKAAELFSSLSKP